MLKWSIWQGNSGEWDEMLMQFPDYTVYQSYNWGEYRGHFGWMPYRLTAADNGETQAMAQILARRFTLGVVLAWVNGGPIGNINAVSESFRTTIRQAIGSRFLYCRVNPMREQNKQNSDQMIAMAWTKPETKIHSGSSLAYLPSVDDAIREARASRNWRHNLRRASKYGHETVVWSHPDPDEILTVYKAMETHKNLAQQISHTALTSLFDTFRGQCLLVRCSDAEGRLLALRGALLMGHKAWDVLAAATPIGRKVYASHAAFWELTRQCALRGIQWYDMSGVDPINNKGVYNFKKGTGAGEVSYLGEWDWATSSVLRRTANILIKHRFSAA